MNLGRFGPDIVKFEAIPKSTVLAETTHNTPPDVVGFSVQVSGPPIIGIQTILHPLVTGAE